MAQFPSQTNANGLWTIKKVKRNLQGSNFPTFPGAPTIGTATGGNAQASVTFTAPAATGGASITSYTVTSSPGGLTGTGSSSPITVTGLTNGTAYTFTVQATTFVTGPASAASNSVTPVAVNKTPTVEYLVVAGGGGGGGGWDSNGGGGGGGAGGYRTASGFSVSSGSAITVTIGAGGARGFNDPPNEEQGFATNGNNSVFSSVTSTGGGRGSGTGASGNAPGNGGSGGGGGIGGRTAGTGTSGQGFRGGNLTSSAEGGGGGGGAGAQGTDAIGGTQLGTAGGVGLQSSITGTATYYAGGGGGGSSQSQPSGAAGGLGGGGTGGGGGNGSNNGDSGTTNSGGGGGGGKRSLEPRYAGNGGSGVVIIRYANTYDDAVSTTGSPTFTNTGGFKIYRWTGSGSITF